MNLQNLSQYATKNYVASGFYPNTGFINPTGITVTYSGSNRCLYLTGDVQAYYHGTKVNTFSGGWVSEPHTATPTTDLYYYYNGTSGLWATVLPNFDSIQVGDVAFGPTGAFFFGIKNTHGFMPWETHEELHRTIGTFKESGGDLGSYTLSSTTAAERRPTISACIIHDEDIETTINALTNDLYAQYYIVGASASGVILNDQADIVPLNAAQPYYNQYTGGTWQQTLMTNNNYMSVWLVALPVTNDTESQRRRFLWYQGQSQGTLASQQGLATVSLNTTRLSELASEFVFIAKVIIKYLGGDWTIEEVDNLSGTKINQVSSPAGLYLSTVSIDSTLSGDGTAGNPLSISGSLATVATNLNNASGTLVSGYTTAISNVSGAIVTTSSGVSNYLDGLLSGAITTHFHEDINTASGSLISSMESKDSALSGTLQTTIYNASGLFLKKDGSTPLTADWNAGAYSILLSGAYVSRLSLVSTDGFNSALNIDTGGTNRPATVNYKQLGISKWYAGILYDDGDAVNDKYSIGTDYVLSSGKFTILRGGNVGIGENNPTSPLEIYKANGSQIRINTTTDYGAGIFFAENNVNKWELNYNPSATAVDRIPDTFEFVKAGTNVAPILIKDSNCNVIFPSGVGIGYNNPTSKLDVSGVITASGLIYNGYQSITIGPFPELVTNGGFDADSDWTKYSATISAGAGHTAGALSSLQQNLYLTVGRRYSISWDVSNVVGENKIYMWGLIPVTVIVGSDSVIYECTDNSVPNTIQLTSYAGGSCDWNNITIRDAGDPVNLAPTHYTIVVTNATEGGEGPNQDVGVILTGDNLAVGSIIIVYLTGLHGFGAVIRGVETYGGDRGNIRINVREACMFFKSIDGWSPMRTQPQAE